MFMEGGGVWQFSVTSISEDVVKASMFWIEVYKQLHTWELDSRMQGKIEVTIKIKSLTIGTHAIIEPF